jgi:nitrate reductase gamma subunit
MLYDGELPLRQLVALVGTGLFVGLSWLLIRRFFARQSQASATSHWILLALLGVLIVVADIWLFFWA